MAQAMRWYPLNLPLSSAAIGVGDSHAPLSTDSLLSASALHPLALSCQEMPRGMAYGDGFFTTIGVYQGQALWQSYHAARLQTHCQALHLYLPNTLEDSVWQQVASFAEHIQHGLIKIIVSRQAQSVPGYAHAPELTANQALIWLGVLPSATLAHRHVDIVSLIGQSALSAQCDAGNAAAHTTAQITATRVKLLQQAPISAMCLTARLASMPPPLAGLKTLNRLDSVLLAGELQRHQQAMSLFSTLQTSSASPIASASTILSEGLVRDMSGNWVEGVMSNVFYQLHGADATCATWYTPPIIHSGVNGIMRQVIVDKLASSAAPIQLRALQDKDLHQLSAMFFCNAVRGIIPVRELWLDAATCIELTVAIYAAAE